MKKLLLFFPFFLSGTAMAQVFWSENFDTPNCASGSGCDQSLVAWTLTNTGSNGGAPNTWYVSSTEAGVTPPGCGTAGGTNQTLHVGNVSGSSAAPLFCPTGDCGASYDASGSAEVTDKRVESPPINCSGRNNITLSFNYIENGQGASDDATLWYHDGATWALLDPLAKTPVCGSGQGQWTAFSIPLPASANNNPAIRIGFRWVNNGDGVGTDPSFAVDEIQLSATATGSPPTASFTASQTALCTSDCISFTNTSSGGPFTSVSWTFTGATPSASTQDNPANICYATPGTYPVSLTVTNANGTDTRTESTYITVTTCAAPPVADFSASPTTVCAGSQVTFTDLSTGTPTAWNWTFAGGTPASSTVQHPVVIYNTPGTYAVTLVVSNSAGNHSVSRPGYITVTDCGAPVANFSMSSNVICQGSCLTLTNTSTGGTSYNWFFPGGTPASSTAHYPGQVCYANPGSYSITLEVTNANGTTTTSQTVMVGATVSVTAYSDAAIQLGQSVPLQAVGSGSGGSYSWWPSSGLSCAACSSPVASPTATTMYIVTYSSGGCTASDTIRITVLDDGLIGVPNAFSPNGDGLNDVLRVRGSGIQKMNFVIYNRYGQKVFESNDPAVGWDGTYDGKRINGGVFAWYLDYTLVNGETGVLKGNVTLIR